MFNDIFIKPFVDMFEAPDFLLQVLWEGLVSGVLYALIALGLVLIFAFFGGLGGMAVVAALWGIWHAISGIALASVMSRTEAAR